MYVIFIYPAASFLSVADVIHRNKLLLFRSAPSFAADGGGCQLQEKVDASSRKNIAFMLISKRMGCLAQPVIEG
jgi:hypothetical protein